MRPSRDFTMEQHLIQQYLARIGYASSPDQQSLEPDPNAYRSGTRQATAERLLLKVLDQSKEQYAAQQQQVPTANISSRPAVQIRGLESCDEPSFLPDASFTTPSSGTETSYEVLEPRHEHESQSSHRAPLRPIGAETFTGYHSELERRRRACLKIERQIESCQNEIRAHPSTQKKINKQHEKRIAELVRPPHDEKEKLSDAEMRKRPKTAEEAEVEEMREIYLQYDHESIGVANAETVDAFFLIIADTERDVKTAEDANKAAKRRGAKLEGKLYEARCAMDDGIRGWSGGGAGQGVVSGGNWV